MKKFYFSIVSTIFIILLILTNGCSLFEKAQIKLYKEGSLRFYITSLNPYEASFAGEGYSYYQTKITHEFTSLPEPDIQQIIITRISISQDGENWIEILPNQEEIDLNDKNCRNYQKGYPIGSWASVPEGVYSYVRIFFKDVIVGKASLKYDSIIQDIKEKGLDLNPLELTPQNSPPFKIYAEDKNTIYFNFYLDEVLDEDNENQRYTVNNIPSYSIKSANLEKNIQIKGSLDYTSLASLTTTPKYVALFSQETDYLNNTIPLYGTVADYKNTFYFSNIPEGTYYLGAYIDINGTKKYEQGIDYGMPAGPVAIEIKEDSLLTIEVNLERNLPPDKPTLQADNITARSISLSWSENTNSDFSKYILYQLPNNYTFPEDDYKIYETTNSKNTSYSLSGLSPESTYYFILRTYDYSGSYTESDKLIVTTDSVLEKYATYTLPATFEAYGIGTHYLNKTLILTSLHHTLTSETWIAELNESNFRKITATYEVNSYLPTSLTYNSSYYLIPDLGSNTVEKRNIYFSYSGTITLSYTKPAAIIYDRTYNYVYISFPSKHIIVRCYNDSNLTVKDTYNFYEDEGNIDISDFALVDGELWSCDSAYKKIYRHGSDMKIKEKYSFPDGIPTGIEYFNNLLYIVDKDGNRIIAYKINDY